jgi:hypothetical protein
MLDCICGNWDQTTRAKIGRAIKVDLRGYRMEDMAVGQLILCYYGWQMESQKFDILAAIWCRHIRVWCRGTDNTVDNLRQVVEARG